MDIRISVFPTSDYPRLITYTTNYKIRNSMGNSFLVLLSNYSQITDSAFPYQIIMGNHIRYLTYERGRSIERILNYISHREEIERYEEK